MRFDQSGPITGDISRRNLVLMAAASASLTACATPTVQPPIPDLQAAIDPHCHVFTGKDIPAAQFVMLVAAREMGFEDFAKIAAFAVSILRKFAPTAQDEIDHLAGTGFFSLGQSQLKNQVKQTLVSLKAAAAVGTDNIVPSSTMLEDLQRSPFGLTPQGLQFAGATVNPEALALATLKKNYPQPSAILPQFLMSPPSDASVLSKLRSPSTADILEDLESLANSIVSDIASVFAGRGETALGRYLTLIAIFLSYRAENVRRLDGSLGLAVSGRTRLYCPAIVDYDMWLGATADTSQSLDAQAVVMERVSRTTDPDVLVAGYMAFDPLRAVVGKLDHGPADQSVLNTVISAVQTHGFIGAKLYPPMGFKPWNNKIKTDGADYPDIVKALLRAHGADPASFDLGTAIDTVLDELYQYCLTHDVPILAHCGNSQTAFNGSGGRASPFYWEELLKRPGYQNLRLNLGHFGGLWCAAENIAGTDSESMRCQVSMDEVGSPGQTAGPNAWPTKIMSLISSTDAQGNPLYPNLTCDIADVGALDSAGTAEKISKLLMGNSAANTPQARDKILYGTDWMFLVMSDGYNKFAASAESFAMSLGMGAEDLLWRNARRFLGLTAGGASLTRLQKFYANDPVRLSSLNRLADLT